VSLADLRQSTAIFISRVPTLGWFSGFSIEISVSARRLRTSGFQTSNISTPQEVLAMTRHHDRSPCQGRIPDPSSVRHPVHRRFIRITGYSGSRSTVVSHRERPPQVSPPSVARPLTLRPGQRMGGGHHSRCCWGGTNRSYVSSLLSLPNVRQSTLSSSTRTDRPNSY
jgi:hypothetical protein